MPKKEWTPEERKAFGAKMKAARAAKENKDTPQNDVIAKMMSKIEELEATVKLTQEQKFSETAKSQGATVGPLGIQGVVTRFEMDPSYYPDPTDRLYDDPELRRYAMRENYVLRWEVSGQFFENKGVSFEEPKFTVELLRYPREGEELPANFPEGGLIYISRHVQHEDDVYARIAARKLGIDFTDDEKGLQELRDEMRYRRIRTWLLERFKPNTSKAKNRTIPMAIGGTIVEVEDREVPVSAAQGVAEAAELTAATALSPEERDLMSA